MPNCRPFTKRCRSADAEERRCPSFSAGGLFNFTSLLLSKEDAALYVGAREALFALDPADIAARERQRNVRASEMRNSEVRLCLTCLP